MYIEIYLYAGNNRKKSEKDPPGRQPTTPGAKGQPGWQAPCQGGGHRAHLAGTTPSVASHITDPRDIARSPSKASKVMLV